MRSQWPLIVVLALVLGACSSDAADPATTTAAGPTSTSSDPVDGSTVPPQGSTTTASDGASTTISDRPAAPDFSLELGDGGTYTLSEGDKPVYLVFWAEW